MACSPGGAFLPNGHRKHSQDTDQVTVFSTHWGKTLRDARNDNVVKIVQIDSGDAERWWLVYAYPFIVDAFATHLLHHPDVTVAGYKSTHELVRSEHLPLSYGRHNLGIPEAHVIVLYTADKADRQADWSKTFTNIPHQTLYREWITPLLCEGVCSRNMSREIEKRPSAAGVRRNYGTKYYELWSAREPEEDDEYRRYDNEDDYNDPLMYSYVPDPQPCSEVTLVTELEFERRTDVMRELQQLGFERTEQQDHDLQAAADALWSCAIVPSADTSHHITVAMDPCTEFDRYDESDRIESSIDLLKHFALVPAAAAAASI
jgi:hypothetical protein